LVGIIVPGKYLSFVINHIYIHNLHHTGRIADRISFVSLFNDSPELRIIVIDDRKNLMHLCEMKEFEEGRV